MGSVWFVGNVGIFDVIWIWKLAFFVGNLKRLGFAHRGSRSSFFWSQIKDYWNLNPTKNGLTWFHILVFTSKLNKNVIEHCFVWQIFIVFLMLYFTGSVLEKTFWLFFFLFSCIMFCVLALEPLFQLYMLCLQISKICSHCYEPNIVDYSKFLII